MQDKNTSLRWKLSWQLSLVFVTIVGLVTIGLSLYGAMTLSPNLVLTQRVSSAIKEAIALDDRGRIEIRNAQSLLSLKHQTEGFWYVVSNAHGETISYGEVPAAYTDLAPFLDRFFDADLKSEADVGGSASIETVDTAVGEVSVMFGRSAGSDWVALTLLLKMTPIYVPLLCLMLPAIFLVIPRIVQRALIGLDEIARKAASIELRSPGERLPAEAVPREVAPLVVAFNGVLERLEHEYQKRQRFLIDAAHELRTPIAIMQTRIEGMPEGKDRRRLQDDVARMGETAEELLDFERTDQAADLNETVDLVDIARTVVADLAPLAIAAGYEISFQSEVDKLERQGSPSALPRAISNLVRNAIDHGGNAGMISISVSASGQVAVADEGRGIPPDQQELVFEPFYRVTPRSKGAGLGLSLVKQIVTNHHGQVAIESGSTGTKLTIQI